MIGFVDSSSPNMRSEVAMALVYVIDPDTPKNDGTFRPLGTHREGRHRGPGAVRVYR